MEETACSEWSDRLDIVGTNHWLPAYGFQQPTQLQQALLQQQDNNGKFRPLMECSCIPWWRRAKWWFELPSR